MPETDSIPQNSGLSLRLSCPKCFTQMVLKRSEPEKPGFDNLTFDCPRCGHTDSWAFKI
jgi:hypothetical protein